MTPQQILSLRKRLGMNQPEFARKLGLGHRASVCRLEKGERRAQGALLALLILLDRMYPEKNPQKNGKSR